MRLLVATGINTRMYMYIVDCYNLHVPPMHRLVLTDLHVHIIHTTSYFFAHVHVYRQALKLQCPQFCPFISVSALPPLVMSVI